jgi:hypothetical protein
MEKFLTGDRKPVDYATTNSISVSEPKSRKYYKSYLSLGYTNVYIGSKE